MLSGHRVVLTAVLSVLTSAVLAGETALHLSLDLGAGLFAGCGSPVPVTASLRASPAVSVAGDRWRAGATAGAFLRNPGVDVMAGPEVALRLRRVTVHSGGEIARVHAAAHALFGKGDARIVGGALRLELPEVVSVALIVDRETRRRDWRIEAAVGLAFERRDSERRARAATRPVRNLYDAARVKSRTKAMAAAAEDGDVATRLAARLEAWSRRPPADMPALEQALHDAGLAVLAEGDLGLDDTRRSAAASFPDTAIDERRLVRAVLDGWRDALEGRAR